MDVQMPDGTLITGVPEGTTKAQLQEKYAAHIGGSVPAYSGPIARNQGAPAVSTGPENPEMQANQDLDLATSALFNATPIGPAIRSAGYLTGLLSTFSTEGANKAQDWADKHLTYHAQDPRTNAMLTDAGSRISKVTAPIDHAVGNAWNDTFANAGTGGAAVKSLLEDTGTMAGHVANVAPLVSGVASGVGGLADAVAASRAAKDAAPARAPLQMAEAAGFRVAPSDVKLATAAGGKPNPVASLLEDTGGSGHVEQGNQLFNKDRTNVIAAHDMGLPSGTVLTPDAYRKAMEPHVAVYSELRKSVPATELSKPVQDQILTAGRGNDSVRKLPAIAQKEIDDIANVGPMNGSQLIDTISELRKKGFEAKLSDSPDIKSVGDVQLDLANALEKQLRTNVETYAPNMVGQYEAARRSLAKGNLYQEVGLKAGNGYDIDAHKLAKIAAGRNDIDGGAKIIADVATHFPYATGLNIPKTPGKGIAGLVSTPIKWAGAPARALLSATRGESAVSDPRMVTALQEYFQRERAKLGPVNITGQQNPINSLAQAVANAKNRSN